MSELNIFQRMSAATNDIKTVAKNLTVGFGKSQYKAVAEKDILAAVKEAEQKYGIFSYPANRNILVAEDIVANEDGREKRSRYVRIETTYRFVNMDKPDEYVEVIGYGDGVDTLDKAPGKAITYSDKYCLMKAYKVETGDDPDANASDDLDAHSITKIKQRVQELITNRLAKGADIKDIYAALNLNEKQFNTLLGYYDKLYSFEAALKGKVR